MRRIARSAWPSRWLRVMLAVTLLIALFHPAASANHKYGGSGTCWKSGAAWDADSAVLYYNSTVPANWYDDLDKAAAAWNWTQSSFLFTRSTSPPGNGNKVQVANLGSTGKVAVSDVYATPSTISKAIVTFNSYYNHQQNGDPTAYDVWNTGTHELGHWLMLFDLSSSGCSEQTMWWRTGPGKTKKRSLGSGDAAGIQWQYP